MPSVMSSGLPHSVSSILDVQSSWFMLLTYLSLFLAALRYLSSTLSTTFHVDVHDLLRRLFLRQTYQIEIDSAVSARLYNQVMAFLSAQPSFSANVRVVCAVLHDGFSTVPEQTWGAMTYRRDAAAYTESVLNKVTDDMRKMDRKDEELEASASPSRRTSSITLCPGFHLHTFVYQATTEEGVVEAAVPAVEVKVEVRRGQASQQDRNSGAISNGTVQKPVLALTVALRHAPLLQRMLREAERSYSATLTEHVLVFSLADGGHSLEYSISKKRDASTLVLSRQCRALFQDAQSFFTPQSKRFYAARGVPYRRGYLLYGQPGTGKSSFVLALASFLNANIYSVSLSEASMSDSMLRMLFSRIPAGSVILLEDVDCLFVEGEKDTPAALTVAAGGARQTTRQTRVTMSGLLNAIDGVASQEGSLVIMTTNHKAKLDPALIRAGRVDEHVEFLLPDTAQAAEAYCKLFRLDTALDSPTPAPVPLALPPSSHVLQQMPRDRSAVPSDVAWLQGRTVGDEDVPALLAALRETFEGRQYRVGEAPFLSFADLQAVFLACHRHPLCQCFPQANGNGMKQEGKTSLNEMPATLACAVQFMALLKEREPTTTSDKSQAAAASTTPSVAPAAKAVPVIPTVAASEKTETVYVAQVGGSCVTVA